MKNFSAKKITGIMLVFILAFTVITVQALVYENFPDVPQGADFAKAVNLLADLGIVRGDEQGNFNPSNTITRAEFATMICRLLGVEDDAISIKTSSFTDIPANHWAVGYVAKAVELGLVNGYGDGRFGPTDTLTYEQAITILTRIIGFENEAISAGGYPSGYIKIANDLEITKNTIVSKSLFNINISKEFKAI